jgi:hypothetical protein
LAGAEALAAPLPAGCCSVGSPTAALVCALEPSAAIATRNAMDTGTSRIDLTMV